MTTIKGGRRNFNINDFEKIPVGNQGFYYFRTLIDDLKICFEPCAEGFDVAMYKNNELVEPKVCTKMKILSTYSSWIKALFIANQMYRQRKNKLLN